MPLRPPGEEVGSGNVAGYSPAEVALDDPAARSRAVLSMMKTWEPIELCVGGTEAIKANAERVIPREPREQVNQETGDDPYQRRIFNTVLPPFLQRLVAQAAGTILRKGIHLSGGDEEYWNQWAQDVTGDSVPLNEFARKTLVDALLWGHKAVLVDYSADTSRRTLLDEQKDPRRPYLVEIHPKQICGWRTTGNRRQADLEQFRYIELVSEPKGSFGEEIIEQVRVLEPGKYRVYRSAIEDSLANGKWELKDVGVTSLDRVPVVGVYSNRLETMMSRPPLLEVALLNLAYCRRFTDYHHSLHVGAQPVLLLKGFDPDGNTTLGLSVNTALLLPPEGDGKYIEPTSDSYNSQLECLQTLEDQISNLGISALARQNITNAAAESKRLDRIDSDSIMAIISQDLARAIQEMIDIASDYTGRAPCKVTIPADYESKLLDGNQITAMLQLQMQNQISQETLLELLKEGEVIPTWIDIDQEILRTKDEMEEKFELELEHQEAAMEMVQSNSPNDPSGGAASGDASKGSLKGSQTLSTPMRPGKHAS